ncbi:MobC family plasmid mobilization relaxosome protein [Bifidobacterium amazonense]|uniref:MobC family plasmid mobilization relaxosome protein n=1 Tax=Bifidobacterium amazonense TaxID=2809027 RepID=A0ABS9VUW4_9BIFI|nr:MobC family plasmid mobilization relaxosome protein [Bifidobacterium amazonense]MCH9275874.1 MobC family plasmid mobilization relaxosome protein [Bifidobacterium amazonense]
MSWQDTHPNRCHRKTVTFTPEEWAEANRFYQRVKRSRGGVLSFSAHARELLIDAHTVVITVALDPGMVRADMARIGNNINQIARVANTSGQVTASDLEPVLAGQRELRSLFLRMCRERDEALETVSWRSSK